MLDYKRWVKNGRNENEIYRVKSPSSEDSKNIILFSSESLILEDARLENLVWPSGQRQGSLLLCNIGSGQF